jgi:hypothetical protein
MMIRTKRWAAFGLLAGTLFLAVAHAQGVRPQMRRPTQPSAPSVGNAPAGHVTALAPRAEQPLQIPAPTGLASTTDVQVCSQHGSFVLGLICKAQLGEGKLVLVWDFPKTRAQVTGFHIYRVDGPKPLHVGDQANGPQVTGFVLDAPPPGANYSGACFEVTAYGPGEESALSNTFCASAGSTARTLVLSPSHWRAVVRDHSKDTHVDSHDWTNTTSVGEPQVGYSYNTWSNGFGDDSENMVYRTGIVFDVSPLVSHRILFAHLRLRVDSAWLEATYDIEHAKTAPPTDHLTSCAAKIAALNTYWWNYADWIDGPVVLSPGRVDGPDVSIDITSMVRAWAGGEPNFGIGLEGDDENLNAFTERACTTTYLPDQIQLEVVYV